MAAYVTESYYISTYGGRTVPEEDLRSALHQASRHIDSLTYNRIVGRGFDNLTDSRKRSFRKLYVCRQILNVKMQMRSTQSYPVTASMAYPLRLAAAGTCSWTKALP